MPLSRRTSFPIWLTSSRTGAAASRQRMPGLSLLMQECSAPGQSSLGHCVGGDSCLHILRGERGTHTGRSAPAASSPTWVLSPFLLSIFNLRRHVPCPHLARGGSPRKWDTWKSLSILISRLLLQVTPGQRWIHEHDTRHICSFLSPSLCPGGGTGMSWAPSVVVFALDSAVSSVPCRVERSC